MTQWSPLSPFQQAGDPKIEDVLAAIANQLATGMPGIGAGTDCYAARKAFAYSVLRSQLPLILSMAKGNPK